jgi:hypothetical protein
MTGLKKMAEENRKHVMKIADDKAEAVAYRDKLDLKNPTDRETAYSRACTEDREFYNLYRRVISVPVREASLME